MGKKIENSRVPCHIGTVLLTWEYLEAENQPSVLLPNEEAGTIWCRYQLGCKQLQEATEVNLPLETYPSIEESPYYCFGYWRIVLDPQGNYEGKACSGIVGPGSLWIEYVESFTDPKDWYISEVLGAAYENKYGFATLKYIFVDNIVETETREFCLTQLLTERNGLCRPPPENKVFVWRYSSAEFRALLGTPIGRVVAGLVLCVIASSNTD
ncbi:uncharacterized protein N7496_003716 [Penicillium cataractarum]|uniref:Uncharacterized protein n=1 Tax=Penicillium cataractarum TaxID=2100454 RepID=A0A9W9SML7_9EURO|nr:uncharacterized protein N7496_003716 [Penicillium cataractarum]KAJ5381288.1 hypothetical protein N7496_003716 [Penicillium cataractarum]